MRCVFVVSVAAEGIRGFRSERPDSLPMKQEEAVRAAAALGSPFGGRFFLYDLSAEAPDFSEDVPIFLMNPKGLSFGWALSAALAVRDAETPVGVSFGNGDTFVTTLEAIGEYDELLGAGAVVVIGCSKTRFLEDEDGDVCGIVTE